MSELITTFKVINGQKAFNNTIKVINKFRKKNNMELWKLNINFDFNDKDFGYYVFEAKEKHCTIAVNPKNIIKHNIDGTNYHPDEVSIHSVIIHEFSHFIDDIFKIEKAYLQAKFSTPKLVLNVWATECIEEIAEILTMLILNPFLLKVIDKERYKWFTQIVKPVLPVNKKQFFKTWNMWSYDGKEIIRKRFNLIVSESSNSVRINPKPKPTRRKYL